MAGLELLSDQGYRVDGRRAGELRKIQARMGVFAQADGSAYIEQGNTKALAVVYGPHEIRGSRARALPDRALVNCQYSSATFSTGERKRRPHGDRKSCEMGLQLRQTFEAAVLTQLHPRSQIDIYVQESLGPVLLLTLGAKSTTDTDLLSSDPFSVRHRHSLLPHHCPSLFRLPFSHLLPSDLPEPLQPIQGLLLQYPRHLLAWTGVRPTFYLIYPSSFDTPLASSITHLPVVI
ncbi:exosome complex component RRP41 isoform X2 [Physeter macrocephalus]|uniref:Exosome complex component RRP41 isoform X2 n=1 Tax=Physeter macrocephalus TaxID=9755 RepID=A0A455B2Y0_PHYMC|nr:exosome complex component RRP41 isoform X2 [Physeter catodon]|eukprot:XP_028343137.1 exosome complex component RRP41 isoform X2 [Physeter catodon]